MTQEYAAVTWRNFFLWFSVAVVWVVTAGIYWNGAKDTDGIGGGDSAELALTALDHGTSHPPGYPLLHLILSTGCHILISSGKEELIEMFFIAYSVLSASFAVSLYALFLCRFTDSILVGCTTFLFFALSDVVWTYSLHIEVFSLNHLFISIILNLMYSIQYQTRCRTNHKTSKLVLLFGAFFSGLSLCNQQTIIVYLSIWIAWVAIRARKQLFTNYRPKMMLIVCGAAFFIGLSFYLYLPFTHPAGLEPKSPDAFTRLTTIVAQFISDLLGLDSPQNEFPRYSWGNTKTFGGWLHHVLRKDYGTSRLFPAQTSTKWFETLQNNLSFYVSQSEFNNSIIALFVLGLARQMFITAQGNILDIGNVLLLSLAVYLFGFFALCNIPLDQEILRGIFARFFQQANLLVYVFVALGVSVIEKMILWIVFVVTYKRVDRIIVQLSLVVILLSIFWIHLQVSHPEYIHLAPSSEVTKNVFHTWTENVLKMLPPQSVLLLYGDMETNIIHYYQHRRKIRPDVMLISAVHLSHNWWDAGNYRDDFPLLEFPGTTLATHCKNNIDQGREHSFSMNAFLDSNYHRFPFFSLLQWPKIETCLVNGTEYTEKYELTSFGLCSKIIPKSQEIEIEDRLAILEPNIPRLESLKEFHSVNQINQNVQLRYEESAWESRLIWHYSQPWHSKAYYQYYQAITLLGKASQFEGKLKETLESEAKVLLLSCVDIYNNLFNATTFPLPEYMHSQFVACRNTCTANLLL